MYGFSENEVKTVLGDKVLKDMKSVLDDIDIVSEENKQLLEQLRGLSWVCLFMINSCARRIAISLECCEWKRERYRNNCKTWRFSKRSA